MTANKNNIYIIKIFLVCIFLMFININPAVAERKIEAKSSTAASPCLTMRKTKL